MSLQVCPENTAQGTERSHSLTGGFSNHPSSLKKARGPNAEHKRAHLLDHYIVATYLLLISK